MTQRDYKSFIEAFLRKRGIADYRFERGGKHPKVVVIHNGRRVTVPYPATSHSPNFHHVIIQYLRRALDRAAA